jgi:hypothetical protein
MVPHPRPSALPPGLPPRQPVSARFKKGLAKLLADPHLMEELSADAEASKYFDPSSPSTREYLFTSFMSLG